MAVYAKLEPAVGRSSLGAHLWSNFPGRTYGPRPKGSFSDHAVFCSELYSSAFREKSRIQRSASLLPPVPCG